jgi:hypothetical protein
MLFETRVGPVERWRPKHFPFDTVIVENDRGFASWQALRWLAQEGVTVSLLDFDGNSLSTIVPRRSVNVVRRLEQYRLASDPEARFEVAKAIVAAKIGHAIPLWVPSLDELRLYEGREASVYWAEKGITRDYPHARDSINARLNFAFSLLESRVRVVIHAGGYDPAVGFLHEPQDGKSALVYDLMEPWRDLATQVALKAGPAIGKGGYIQTFAHGWRLKSKSTTLLADAFARQWTRPVEESAGRFLVRALGQAAGGVRGSGGSGDPGRGSEAGAGPYWEPRLSQPDRE